MRSTILLKSTYSRLDKKYRVQWIIAADDRFTRRRMHCRRIWSPGKKKTEEPTQWRERLVIQWLEGEKIFLHENLCPA
jgi:hypothetical protein